MSVESVRALPLTLAERRVRVTAGDEAGKSNRLLAKELGVDEGTIRRDRKMLQIPAKPRVANKPSGSPTKPRIARFRNLFARNIYITQMLDAAKLWVDEQRLTLPNFEYVLDKAEKLLHVHWNSIKEYPEPAKSPSEMLALSRPNYMVEEFMPDEVEFCGDWLARWVACCLPGDQALQNRLFVELSQWARSR